MTNDTSTSSPSATLACKLGIIDYPLGNGAFTRFYVAIAAGPGKPAVVFADSNDQPAPSAAACADELATLVLREIPALQRFHPHQIDWYVTHWLREIDRAVEGDTHADAAVRALHKLEFRVVASDVGSSAYRIAGPLVSPLDTQPEPLLSGIDGAYQRILGPVRGCE